MTKHRYFKPMLAAVGAFTFWGFSFLASKLGQSVASPFIILMYRFDIAALVMALPWILRKQKVKLRGKNIKGLLGLGLCEPILYFFGEQYGIKYTNSAFSGVMIAIIPIVTLILTAAFLKEKPTMLQWLFSLVSIAGVIAITVMAGGEGEVSTIGVALLLLAVITAAAFSVISRGISNDFSVYERSFIMLLMGAVFFTLFALTENRNNLSNLITPLMSGNFIFSILYLSFGASVAGFTLYNYAVSNAPMVNVSSLCNLTTVLSVVAGVVILGEPFSPGSAIALVVILAGIWGVQRTGPNKAEVPSPSELLP